MIRTRYSAERLLDAPAAVVYHCLADYQEHHRPEGFLPPQFSDHTVLQGGVGAGTVFRFSMTLGGRRRTVTTAISEPQPGRVLVERGSGVETTFTVEPVGQQGEQARVRFDTVLEAGGLQGIFTRLFAARLLSPLYADELQRLERYAQAHPASLPSPPDPRQTLSLTQARVPAPA
jgi:Polyketide cyclase / dehydrase and lipid transport